MNNNKSKLFSTLIMVIISALIVSTASFAWFTISTAPEISSINATVVSNENLEIVLDNGYTAESIPESDEGDYDDPYTWGNLVDLELANTAYTFKLVPVEMDGDGFNYPTYGFDGRIKSMESLEKRFVSDSDREDYSTVSGGYAGYFNPDDEVEAIGITYWLRSNEDCDILLAEPDTYRADDGKNAEGTVNAVQGKGSTISFDFSDEVNEANALAVNVDNAFKAWAASQTEENETALLAAELRFKNSVPNDIDMVFGFYREYEESGKKKVEFYSDAASAMAGYKSTGALTSFKLYDITYDRIYSMLDSLHVIFQVIDSDGTINKTLYGSAMRGEYYIPDDWATISSIEIKPSHYLVDPYRVLYKEVEGNKYYRARGEMIYSGEKLTDYSDRMAGKLTVNLVFSTSSDVTDKDNNGRIKEYYDILKTNETEITNWPQSVKDDWLVKVEKPATDSIPKISLTANEPLKIQSYIYLDGTTATNAVALTFQDTDATFNIQFWNPDCKGQAMTVKDSSPTT